MRLRRLGLLPVAWAYGGAAGWIRGAYKRGWLPVGKARAPVVSVGALAAGGSGKTPVAAWLASHFQHRGLRVGVVHSGYGGEEARRVQRLDPGCRWEPGAARRFGDESVMLAGWLPRALVVSGRDKLAGARLASAEGAQVVVVDDGFQHRRLYRDLDLLLVDWPAQPLLPAGDRREPASAAAAADLHWEHCRSGGPPATGAPVASRLVPDAVLGMDGKRAGDAEDLRGRRVYLMAGIARPEAFESSVAALGAVVVGRAWVRDHRCFSARAWRGAGRSGAELVLCTEKDAARLVGVPQARSLHYLHCRLELTRGSALLDQRLQRMCKPLLSGE